MAGWKEKLETITKYNKYTKWYVQLISTAKTRNLTEKFEIHHIIPRSLGGDDSVDNLVKLTVREHMVCHVLLCKMLTGQNKYKMLYAVNILYREDKVRINSRIIESLRTQRKLMMVGKGNPNYGKKHTTDSLFLIGGAMRGKKHSDATKKLMSSRQSGSNNHMFGKTHEDASLQLMKQKQQDNRILKICCPHCLKEIDKQNFKRWHGDKCKQYMGQI